MASPAPQSSALLGPQDRHSALALARAALVRHVTSGEVQGLEDLAAEPCLALEAPGAAFVTLTVDGRLRGCIGTMVAHESLGECIVQRTLQASSQDTRFAPITVAELGATSIEISVLTPLRPVAGPEEIVLGQHGIMLRCCGHRAVFLPSVAPDHGWSLDETLDALARKAGLSGEAWKTEARYEVFEAQAFEEEP